jgi:hypothetical protein
MSLPSEADKFSELVEHLRKGAEAAYMLGHLCADSDETKSHGWLGVGQLMERMVIQVTQLATKRRLN